MRKSLAIAISHKIISNWSVVYLCKSSITHFFLAPNYFLRVAIITPFSKFTHFCEKLILLITTLFRIGGSTWFPPRHHKWPQYIKNKVCVNLMMRSSLLWKSKEISRIFLHITKQRVISIPQPCFGFLICTPPKLWFQLSLWKYYLQPGKKQNPKLL